MNWCCCTEEVICRGEYITVQSQTYPPPSSPASPASSTASSALSPTRYSDQFLGTLTSGPRSISSIATVAAVTPLPEAHRKDDDRSDDSSVDSFAVHLDKGDKHSKGATIGVDITLVDMFLRVKQVKDGLVKSWNQEHPYSMVCPGDILVSVNGVSGRADKLLKHLALNQRLQLTFLRPKR
mmetsp:Transcript_13714/g.29921  ORF Transcript_13714/g.29921 Transcript_13714/m.29921 type:complete len:181 (+) Transcript_13714:83-625(+)